MNSFRSWIFFFGLLCQLSSVSSTFIDDPASQGAPLLDALTTRSLHVDQSKVIGPIVGGVVGGVVVIACMIYGFIRLSHQQRQPGLEDGIITPQVSGRQWYSRFKRSGRDAQAEEKTPYSGGKTGDLTEEKQLSAVPRYLKAEVALSPADRPLPPSPAHPRSPRALPSGKGNSLTLNVPSPSPTGRSPTGRSPSRRKVQVASQPVVLGDSPYGPIQSAGGRKRTLLPNIFKQRPADRNPRIPPGFEQVYPNDYNVKMQNARSAPNSANLQSPSTPRSGNDMSIEDDIADLPVKTPRIQVPRGSRYI